MLQLFPAILLLIPLFVIFTALNLVDTLLGCILAYTTTNLAFSIWMIKGFMDSIPFDLEEAGMIDGCTQFMAFLRIIIPVSMPGISTVGIFTFINSWGEYTLASILLRSDKNITLTLGLQKFVLQFTADWPALMTASTIATIPTILFLAFAQKYLVRGMSAGAVKG
jgi:ABC-type glycerol-3-phosphate transport system permease component